MIIIIIIIIDVSLRAARERRHEFIFQAGPDRTVARLSISSDLSFFFFFLFFSLSDFAPAERLIIALRAIVSQGLKYCVITIRVSRVYIYIFFAPQKVCKTKNKKCAGKKKEPIEIYLAKLRIPEFGSRLYERVEFIFFFVYIRFNSHED